VISINGEFLASFPELAEETVYISDGAMDVSGAIDLFVQREARRIAPVRLSGVYGGEILRRLVMFKPRRLRAGLLDLEMEKCFDLAVETYADELEGHRLSFTAFKQAPWYMTGKFAVERSQLTLRTPYFDNELVALAYQAPPELVPSNEPSLRLIESGMPSGLSRHRSGLNLAVSTAAGRIANLAQEFTFKAEYAYDYGYPNGWIGPCYQGYPGADSLRRHSSITFAFLPG
jgi:hypothetical protein